jgi:ribosomal protein S18 acetylase RimI-like enzyme
MKRKDSLAKVQIRPATPADADCIVRFNLLLALETEDLHLDPQTVAHGVAALLCDNAKGTYFVAENEGRVDGQLLITYEWSDWRNGNLWWLQSVYVATERRGHGIFKTLYQHVLALARKDPDVCGVRLYVDAANKHAQHVYRQLGMKKTDYELYELTFPKRGPVLDLARDVRTGS